MCQVACLAAEVLRVGVDGTRAVLSLVNPEPLQFPLIRIHSLTYPRGRPTLDPPPAPFLEIVPFGSNIVLCEDTVTGQWSSNIGTHVTTGDLLSYLCSCLG